MSAAAVAWLPPGRTAWAAWEVLAARRPAPCATSSLAWTRAWSVHYGDVVPHRIALVLHDGAPLGVTVVARGRRRRGGVPVRTLHLGTAGEPPGSGVEAPYGRLLAVPGARGTVAAALLRELRRTPRWDELRLERLHPDDAAALARADPALVATPEPSPAAALGPEHAGDPLTALPPRTRRQLRRAVREHGPVCTEAPTSGPAARRALDELVALHEARHAPGAFADPRFAGFHRALLSGLLPTGELLLVRVRRAGRTLGCVAVLRDGDRALSWTGGIAPAEGPHDKPGFLVHAAAMAVCADRGMRAYDLLGDAPYKRELGRDPGVQVTLRLARPSARTLLGDAGRRVRRHGVRPDGPAVRR